MYKGLSVLWMYEPEKMPARQDMDLSTADYYCGLWKLESLLEHFAHENGHNTSLYSGSGEEKNRSQDSDASELFELKPSMIVKES